jgi:hypothetical protein
MNQEIRTQVLERDNDTCQLCGTTNMMEVHHRIPRLISGDDSLDNQVSYCKSCHDIADTWSFEAIYSDNKRARNVRLSGHTYKYLAKHVKYHESMSDCLERLLGIDKEKKK